MRWDILKILTQITMYMKEARHFFDPMPRCSGRTTRLIDQAIQDIFNGKTFTAIDHAEGGNLRKANEDLFRRVVNRLRSEHDRMVEHIKIDKRTLTIKLKTK